MAGSLAVCCAAAWAGWSVERWGPREGLPVAAVTGLATTPDGRVWIASHNGLASFDGTSFSMVPTSGESGTPGGRIQKIATHPVDGALWLATAVGLQRRSGADVRTFAYDAPDGIDLSVGRGGLWAVAGDALLRLDAEPVQIEPARARIEAVELADGSLCSRERDGGFRCSGPTSWTLPAAARDTRNFLARDATGALLVLDASRHARWRIAPGGAAPVDDVVDRVPHAWPPVPTAWTLNGRVVSHAGERVTELPSDVVAVVAAGDSAWVATASPGLYRIDRASLVTVRPAGDAPHPVDRLWLDERDGRVWARSKELGWWAVDAPEQRLAVPGDAAESGGPGPGAESVPFRIDGALHWRRLRDVVSADGIDRSAGLPERLGAYFVGGGWLGLHESAWRFEDERWTEVAAAQVRDVLSLADGTTWLASAEGPIRIARGARASPPLADWPAPARQLRSEGDRLWVATEGAGLCALRGGTWRCLPDPATVHASLADEADRVWIAADRGIGVAEGRALRAFADGAVDQAPVLWLDERDGMATRETNGFLGSGALRRADGTLAFATQDGVVVADPSRFSFPEPPTVSFPVGSVHVTPYDGPLRIDWSAVAQRHGEQVAFRSRLDGGLWSVASATRGAQLASLSPGRHRFEVQARLGGAWGEAAGVEIDRGFAWHERAWVRGLFGLGGGGLVLLAGVARTRALRRRAAALERAVDARTAELARTNAELSRTADVLKASNAEAVRQTERLDRLVRVHREAVATASHELRTPLTLVLGPLDEVETALLADAPSANRLATVRANAHRLDAIVQRLFQLSRADAGALPLEAVKVDFCEAIRATIGRFSGEAARRAIRLEFEGPAAVMTWCNPEMVDTVLGNLLANAMRFTLAGGSIVVGVRADEDTVEVRVRDTGPGVAEDVRERIFERFARGEGSPGAGLGLALVRDLVELHGGEVGLAPGKGGAEFWFRLPLGAHHLAPEDIAAGASEVPNAPPPPDGRPLLLLVEDDGALRAYLREHLEGAYAVTEAAGGDAALALARVRRPDIVVSDVMMAGGDGLALARAIRADVNLRDVPILLVSSRAGTVDRTAGLGDADDFLAKPVHVPALLAKVGALLKRGPGDRALLAKLQVAADARLADPEFGVDALARAVAMSRRNLHRHMVEAGLDAPTQWLLDRRLTTAQGLLRGGKIDTVGEAAAAVGLSRAYFTRAYTAWCGRSPGEEV